MGGPLGGIILGRRGGYGGHGPYGGRGPYPGGRGGGMGYPHTQSAGTAEIAQRSGGDTFPVDDASALESTLERIRQRYALHFYAPEDAKPGQERNVDVDLASAARRRYPDAEIHYRRVYMTPAQGTQVASTAPAQTQAEAPVVVRDSSPQAATSSGDDDSRPALKRRPGVSDVSGPRGPSVLDGQQTQSQTSPAPAPSSQKSTGGWRRVDEPAPDQAPAKQQN